MILPRTRLLPFRLFGLIPVPLVEEVAHFATEGGRETFSLSQGALLATNVLTKVGCPACQSAFAGQWPATR